MAFYARDEGSDLRVGLQVEDVAVNIYLTLPGYRSMSSAVSAASAAQQGPAGVARHIIGCHLSQRKRVQMRWMMWQAMSARPYRPVPPGPATSADGDLHIMCLPPAAAAAAAGAAAAAHERLAVVQAAVVRHVAPHAHRRPLPLPGPARY